MTTLLWRNRPDLGLPFVLGYLIFLNTTHGNPLLMARLLVRRSFLGETQRFSWLSPICNSYPVLSGGCKFGFTCVRPSSIPRDAPLDSVLLLVATRIPAIGHNPLYSCPPNNSPTGRSLGMSFLILSPFSDQCFLRSSRIEALYTIARCYFNSMVL